MYDFILYHDGLCSLHFEEKYLKRGQLGYNQPEFDKNLTE